MSATKTWFLVSSILSIKLKKGTNRIGREAKTNDIVIAGFGISVAHAEARVTDDAILLRDLGSSNGTFVNGERITQQLVRDGDKVTLGDQTFTAKVEDDPEGADQ